MKNNSFKGINYKPDCKRKQLKSRVKKKRANQRFS